ncbi:hypothetical protein HWHPT5561_09855 [Petrotoga sp. HWH.PT.55.6.1]|uniref:hypothetical protein n=1 Tax=unclassified Petrotoga TaxID=2620614 RepID=UPI000CA00214|nr:MULTISPECIES: hypothetical protein [unclassified Petrotoga]MBL5981520.1 hypothetical protein [Petrotoga sp. 8T1HF07.NaAc.6.1]PNR87275.1 hypothetical protein X925_09755 [Petrotoga sp. 9T1HF07.CasAA.8.2]PNR93875.1 hypothetical protein X926_02520 [Petrotoga sp. HWHPT.55.6.3]RPD35006.1 hypothetical protein HWHPT5561_09855 [Petrotoga sp. HWH.PT.55.6.1]
MLSKRKELVKEIKKGEIELTKEQRIKLAKELGIICDNLILSLIPKDYENLKISDLGEDLMIAMGRTYRVS